MNTPHQEALQTRHADIDSRIATESQRPLPNDVMVAQLKKEKLKLKDTIGGD